MKVEEAIAKIEQQRLEFLENNLDYAGINEAYQMAISALNKQSCPIQPLVHGHWMVDEDGNIECSECGHRGVGDNYCERCGAKMEVDDEHID